MVAISPEEAVLRTKQIYDAEGAVAALAYCHTQCLTFAGDGKDLPMLLLRVFFQLTVICREQGHYDEVQNALDILTNNSDSRIRSAQHSLRQELYLRAHHLGASFYPTVADLVNDVQAALASGNIDYALWSLSVCARRLTKSQGLGDPLPMDDGRLDRLCLLAGERLAAAHGKPPVSADQAGPVVYIATSLDSGGNARAMLDYIRRDSAREHKILLTGLETGDDLPAVRQAPETDLSALSCSIEFAESHAAFETIACWLIDRLTALSPSAVFLFNHSCDPVPIAIVPLLRQVETYFNHHVEFGFCLGASLSEIGHIDQTPLIHSHCRLATGRTPIYIPLTVFDTGPRDPQAFKTDRPLRTACCGTESQLFGQAYAYNYPEAISRILAETGGMHVHIGSLNPAFQKQIALHLQFRRIPPERFRHVEPVTNLSRCLSELDVDLYLTSFPVGGCAEAIEAMASGTPVLCHQNYLSRFSSAATEVVYPDAPRWHDFSDLAAVIREISRDELARQSGLARIHYETHHAAAVLEKAFAGHRPMGVAPPPVDGFQPDYTQQLFDAHSLTAKLKG